MGGRARWAAVAGVLAGLLALLGVAGLLLHGAAGAPSGKATIPSDWQTYHDPAGLFTLRLPKGWAAQVKTGTASITNSDGSASEKTELIVFSDPHSGAVGGQVTVYVAPIQTPFERTWYCRGHALQKASFHNIPAEHSGASWIFNVANAHFQIMGAPSGVAQKAPTAPSTSATAAPAHTATVAAPPADGGAITDLVLDSFQPASAAALAC